MTLSQHALKQLFQRAADRGIDPRPLAESLRRLQPVAGNVGVILAVVAGLTPGVEFVFVAIVRDGTVVTVIGRDSARLTAESLRVDRLLTA